MKRLKLLLLVCVAALLPATARADDGGFWDILWRMDTKFMGLGTDFHLICFDKDTKTVKNCEHMFTQWGNLFHKRPIYGTDFAEIKHEVNLRVTYYWSYGETFPGAPQDIQPNGDDKNNPHLQILKVMPMYVYHVNETLQIGTGAGFLPVFTGSDLQLRGVITPVSLIYGPRSWKGWYVRGDANYLVGDFTAAAFGATGSNFSKGGEWNGSVALGFDIRRLIGPGGVWNPR
jgi:hypothetical protein